MSYAGPLFPLTLSEQDSKVTADRHITYDFSLANEDSLRVWGAGVQDSYVLSNYSEQERTVSVLYPFAGSFNELAEQMLKEAGVIAEKLDFAPPVISAQAGVDYHV